MEYFPHNIDIDFTKTCMLKCPLCLRQIEPEMLRGRSVLSLENYIKISKRIKSQSWCGIYSDPIYHNKFHEIQEIALQYDVNYVVHTNGNGRNNKWWKTSFNLTPNKSIWQFGLDGLKHNAHIYRVGTNFDDVFNIMKIGVKMNVKIIWQYIVFEYNKNNISEAKKIADNEGIIFKTIQNAGIQGL